MTLRGIEEIKTYLSAYDVDVMEFTVPTPTSETAAVAVGCTPAEIAKSILFLVGGDPVLVVTSGDMKVNSSKLKKASGLSGKVKLPDAAEVIHYTGFAPGGVSPFLLPDVLPVFLDESLKRFSVIYPAAGNASSAVRIDYPTLLRLTRGIPADICLPLHGE